MFKIKFAFSVFVLLFMHQLVMLESAPANTNLATSSKIRAKRAFSMVPSDIQRSFEIFDYELHPDVEPHRCLIESAMMHIMLQSCVHFQPRETANYPQDIIFVKGDKCDAVLHDMGTWSNSTINLRDDCFNFGTILHQLMHVLGFEHEHQRSDRDQYLQINYANIANSSIEQFNKELEKYRSIEHNYTEFDIDSITMYGPVGGSVDPERLKTIESKVPGKQVVGPGDKLGLSPLDVKSIKKVYRCSFPGVACRKLALFDNYITKCSVDARKYINLSLIKQLIDKCK